MRDRIDPMIFEKPWDDVRGLAKLLLLEKLRTPEARYAYKERSTGGRSGASWKMQRMMQDPYLKKRLEYSNEKASDYSTVFLPWGPQWNAKKIRKLMMTKDIILNSSCPRRIITAVIIHILVLLVLFKKSKKTAVVVALRFPRM